MKNKPTIPIALGALMILIAAQVYVVMQLYSLKNNAFIRDYSNEIVGAIEALQSESGINLLEETFTKLDGLASDILFETPGFEIETDSVKTNIFEQVKNELAQNETLTPFLKIYLREKDMDTTIHSYFQIHRLALKNFSKRYLIFSDTIKNSPVYTRVEANPGAIFIQRYKADYNNIEIEASYFVDFSNRKKIIVTEMSSALLVLILTVAVVMFVYIRTLKNLMKQRKLSELKSDFISNMTHELKTPLSTIAVASSSLTLDEVMVDKNRMKELSKIITRQNKLLNQMIDQVLNISALERSSFSIHPEKTEIKQFIEDTLSAFKVSKQAEGAIIQANLAIADGFSAPIDRFQLTRVLNNLLSNAVKYCTRQPEIIIETIHESNGLKISVSDNGIGISKEQQKQVFSKFFRGNEPLSGNIKGLGLGLYFVERIVEAHGGTVRLESTPGRGSKFTVEIPT